MTPSSPPAGRTAATIAWLDVHLPAVLYAWFWFGMFLCGLLAPADRVAELQSGVVQQGWHLSAMACVLGLPVIVAYALRTRRRPD